MILGPGLLLHRYEAGPGQPPLAAPEVPQAGHPRRFEIVDATPNRADFHDTDDALPADLAAAPDTAWMAFALMRDVGDSAATGLPWVYVVHTDVPDHIVDEYNAWYDEEHLPRLVRVPGVIRARRYAARTGHPRYLTAYDLTERDAFSSPAGLQARKTPWTEKMRALFTNTRRFTGRLLA